jgi:hypothetical protein
VFVRRWARELPRELSADWRESVYLNLIVHTRFTLTVAICSYAGLKDRSRPGPRTFVKVVKPVYAAPSVARVDLKTNKAAATQLSWPDVYFAVRCLRVSGCGGARGVGAAGHTAHRVIC